MPDRTRSWRNTIRAASTVSSPPRAASSRSPTDTPSSAQAPGRSRGPRRLPPRRAARSGCPPRARRRGGRTSGPGRPGPARAHPAAARRTPRRGARAARAGCRPADVSRRDRASAERRWPSPAASDSASAASRPPTTGSGSPAERTTDGSSRAASRTTTGSAVRRRAAKHSACAEGGSSRWASSTMTASGRSSATRLSRLSTAAPTANRSPLEPGSSASAEPRASACGAGMASSWSSTAQELEQTPERHLPLGIHAGRAQHPHARVADRRRSVVEQRALADPRLAGQQQRAALTHARGGHQPADDLPFALASDQHGSSLGSTPGGSPDAMVAPGRPGSDTTYPTPPRGDARS